MTVGTAPMAERLFDLYRSLPRHNLQSEDVERTLAKFVPGGPKTLADMEEGQLAQVVFQVVNTLRWRRLEPVLNSTPSRTPSTPSALRSRAPSLRPSPCGSRLASSPRCGAGGCSVTMSASR